ncbi:MAG: radical SAM protein [Lentisphaeria bacterium]|nr:radical SAM protein [Lentisphaeria bacterium]
MTGTVFDIKEFALFDGPGIRTTVFLKGCPLRCAWCHNPEGLAPGPEPMVGAGGTRLVGTVMDAVALAERLNRQAAVLRQGEGGVTFSGGEPLLQAAFVEEVLRRLVGIHTALDTCGYGDSAAFERLAGRCDLVLYDLKLMDAEAHRRYTGVDNRLILRNLELLGNSGRPCVVRVPLVPGVTDTPDNLGAVAEAARCVRGLVRVELMAYNRAAGGKYAACNRTFQPAWDEAREENPRTELFASLGVPVMVL